MDTKRDSAALVVPAPLNAKPTWEVIEGTPSIDHKPSHAARHKPNKPADFSDTDALTRRIECAIRDTVAPFSERPSATPQAPKIGFRYATTPAPSASYREHLDAMKAVLEFTSKLPPR